MKTEFLQKAKRITVQELQKNLSKILKGNGAYFVTDNDKPVKVIFSYDSLLDFFETLEELDDKVLLRQVAQGRKEYQKGRKWIPVNRLFKQIRKFRMSTK